MNGVLEKGIPQSVLSEVLSLDLSLDVHTHSQSSIIQALEKTVLFSGKRLRPLLTFLMGEFWGVPAERTRPLARAIEMVHAASLSHDDVIDQAEMRRNMPSINVVVGNKKSVLAGDFLLSKVISEMCQYGRIDLLDELTQVIQDLSEGEWLQMDLIHKEKVAFSDIEKVAMKKTASVLSWCCVAPTLLGPGDQEDALLAKELGSSLGVAFQLIDDTLDFSQDSGKSSALDFKNGTLSAVIYTYQELGGSLDQLDEEKLSSSCRKICDIAKQKIAVCEGILGKWRQKYPQLITAQKAETLNFLFKLILNRRS